MYSGKLIINSPGPSGRGGASLGTSENNKVHVPEKIENEASKGTKKKAKTLAELAKEHEEL